MGNQPNGAAPFINECQHPRHVDITQLHHVAYRRHCVDCGHEWFVVGEPDAEVFASTFGIDLDAMRRRSANAERWFRSIAAEHFGDDWLPLSVREMFANDLPRLRNEVRQLREDLAEARTEQPPP